MKKSIIVISGATATGKSDLAVRIAQELNGEVINADIGSWYTPLTIGTAKPEWKKEPVPHHLFDILDQPCEYDVYQFRAQVQKLAQEIWSCGRIPVVVGGSAFYIKALWYKPHAYDYDQALADELDKTLYNGLESTDALWHNLQTIDAVRAAQIHRNDRYRIVRALVIYRLTGQKPSMFQPMFDPVAPIIGIVCVRDRAELYDRINKRVRIMLDQGWLEEVKVLLKTPWRDFLVTKKIIGYNDIVHYLERNVYSDQEYEKLVSIISQKTRNYAKRQCTFLKKLINDVTQELAIDPRDGGFIEEINLTLCDVGLYIKELSQKLESI